ncbi:swi5-like zinc finger protein [Mortierella claussenii]|nr:swi5-like zinc finger protein [Mortierella claussenii]
MGDLTATEIETENEIERQEYPSEAQQPAAPTEVGQETKEESRGAAATGIPDPSRTPGMILVEHDGQEPLGTTLVMTEEIITEADPADDDHEETEAIPTTAPLESAPITPQARPQMKRGSQERHEASKANEDTKIEELKATILDLQRQEQEIIQSIRGEGTPTEIIDRHIKDLRRYNEIKDVGQIILGKCAELEGTTIKKQYEIFGLDTED